MVPKKLGKELVGAARNLDIIQKIVEAGKNLRGEGQTKDLSKRKCLSELHSRRNGLKKECI